MNILQNKLMKLTIGVSLIIGGSQLLADTNNSINRLRASSSLMPYRDLNLSTWPQEAPVIEGLFPSSNNLRFAITANSKQSFNFVGLGDSYGSGQGAPNNADRAENLHLKFPWLEDFVEANEKKPQWNNRQCRRSSNSAFQKAYRKLKGTSYGDSTFGNLVDMYFVSYACSGSTTNEFLNSREGLGQKYDMYDPVDIDSQFTQLSNDWASNSVDALVMSIGGNDVGFGDAIMVSVLGNISCALEPNNASPLTCKMDNQWIKDRCNEIASVGGVIGGTVPYLVTKVACLGAANRAYEVSKSALRERRFEWKDRLKKNYSLINDTLMSPAYDFIKQNKDGTKNIFIMEYPDALHDSNGDYCDPENIVAGIYANSDYSDLEKLSRSLNPAVGDKFFRALKKEEVIWLGEKVYTPLIETINQAALANNWVVIKSAEESKTYGLCTFNRYVNQNIDSLKRQGADIVPPVSFSGGLIHPNNKGYEMMGNNLYDKLRPLVEEKLTVKGSEMPTRIRVEVVNGILKIHWDDNSDKEIKYQIRIKNSSNDYMDYDVNASINEYSLNIKEKGLLRYASPKGILYINVILVGPGNYKYNINNPGIPFALKKPKMPFVGSTNRLRVANNGGSSQSGIFLHYNPKGLRGIVQIIAWANVDDNVTTQDLHKMAINWIEYKDNTINHNQNTKRIDTTVNMYYTHNKTVGAYTIKRSNKVFAMIKLCNNLGCSSWSPTVKAHPTDITQGAPNRIERNLIPRHDIRTNPVNILNSTSIRLYN